MAKQSKRDAVKYVRSSIALTELEASMIESVWVEMSAALNLNKPGYQDPREWIVKWLAEKNLVFNHKTRSYRRDSEELSSLFVSNDMVIEASRAGIIRDHILRALENYEITALKKAKDVVVEKVAFDGRLRTEEWESLCVALTGGVDKLHIAVLQHFMWQVKMKLCGKYDKVVYHMMPVLVGRIQGKGKTTAIGRLVAPVSDVANDGGRFSMYSDSREAFNLAESFVIVFDEMQKADRADIEAIKNGITSSKVSYRVLGHNRQITAHNAHTAIGSSNQPLNKIVRDTSGARRFWQLDADHLDWNLLDKVDFNELWKSIDVELSSPILPFIKDIEKVQNETIRNKSQVELWLEDSGLDKSEKTTLGDELYRSFVRFVEYANAGHPLSRNSFYDELEAIGYAKIKKKDGQHFMAAISNVQFSSVG
ncbi:VapE domain-containing protein [Bdellovibrio sp. HCB209]|uniref:VapE domain-containing protein n=1 Tax=Bdellovibrio sp. HCB209 TaxID=3394354 RepID=UPI0039B531EC